jgi:hypothetical protein
MGFSFTFLYVDAARTSQETPLLESTAYYGDGFIFLIQMMFVPHRKHTYMPPRLVTGMALLLLFYECDIIGDRDVLN